MSHLRVRHVADVNPPCPAWDRVPDDVELTFVPLEAVWPRRVDVSRLRPKADTASGYTRFQQGDVIVPKITPTFEGDRSTWVAHIPTAVATGTTELHVVRPGPDVDGRYLDHLFSSAPFLRGGEAEMIGVAGQKRVPDAWLRDIPVPIADVAEQRAIADYLDAETARIDALIAKKQQLIHLLEERWAATLADAFGDPSGLRLKHILAAPMAYGVLVPDHVQDGPMMLRISDFRHGDPDPESVARISEMLHRQYRRTIVREGDLVVSVVGTLGRAAIVPPLLIGANLNRALARVQLQPDAPVDLVRLWCESTLFTDQARLATSSDSAQPTLNLGDLKNFELGLPMLRSSWPAILGHMRAAEVWKDQGRGRVTRQINLLAEHRQALITAAVTGQFAIPVAS